MLRPSWTRTGSAAPDRTRALVVTPLGERALADLLDLAPADLAVGASPFSPSSQPRNASRLRVDSPRLRRHSHSLRMEEAKPSSRIVLNDPSA